MRTLFNHPRFSQPHPATPLMQLSAALGTALLVSLTAGVAIAEPEPATSESSSNSVAAAPQEVDSSLTRTYEPTTIYLPDPETYRLAPQVVPIAVDAPVTGAVSQIVDSYNGQDVGIQNYNVMVDEPNQIARINFNVNNELGEDAFNSLSSANQVALFEAIRETLLTEPTYNIEEIIFSANGEAFDI